MENLEKTKIERQFTIEIDNDTKSKASRITSGCESLPA